MAGRSGEARRVTNPCTTPPQWECSPWAKLALQGQVHRITETPGIRGTREVIQDLLRLDNRVFYLFSKDVFLLCYFPVYRTSLRRG